MLIFRFALITIVGITARFHCPRHDYLRQPVQLPTHWSHGSRNCFEEGARQPDLDVFPLNEHTFILRENKCINYEAPFLYLLFGTERVLLIDSGATASSRTFPIQQHVESIITRWCAAQRIHRNNVTLVVAHSHNHADHTAGDEQFRSKPFTAVVRTDVDSVRRFFKLRNWPRSISRYTLDRRRHLAIIPIPGHESSSIAIYDCSTGLLFTGDSLYPGRIYIANWDDFRQSTSRLTKFMQTRRLNVTAILGAHIEMTQTPRVDYPMGATYQPHERRLALSFEHLQELHQELRQHRTYHDAFIVDPHRSQLPLLPHDGRIASHRFLLLPTNAHDHVLIFYQPMFHAPVDFQLVFHARMVGYTAASFDDPLTLVTDQLSLNNLINGNTTSLSTKSYRGAQGKYLDYINLNVMCPLLTVDQVNASEIQRYHPLRYISYPSSQPNEKHVRLYLLHQMRGLPDFDAVVQVVVDPWNCTTDIDRQALKSLLEQNGNEWAFHGSDNNVSHRLKSGYARAQLLGDIHATDCSMHVITELQCRFFSHYHNDARNDSAGRYFHYQPHSCHQVSMGNPDGRSDSRHEKNLFHGFLPLWAIVLFAIAVMFVVIFLAGLVCHLAGCRRPPRDVNAERPTLMIEQPLLATNNQLRPITNDGSQQSRSGRF